MTKPEFVYVTYIATTPDKVWDALTNTDVARQYWIGPNASDPGHVNVSDWAPGSRWEHQRLDDARTADVVGTVIETVRPNRLVLSWARPTEFDEVSKHSRVTFGIEPVNEKLVRVTVTHENFEHDPKMLTGISSGWPTVLSNLKTFLETGTPLPR